MAGSIVCTVVNRLVRDTYVILESEESRKYAQSHPVICGRRVAIKKRFVACSVSDGFHRDKFPVANGAGMKLETGLSSDSLTCCALDADNSRGIGICDCSRILCKQQRIQGS